MNTPKTFTRVLTEGIIVGLLLIPFTYLSGRLFAPLLKKPMLPDVCKDWNRFYVMEINLLLAGILFHLVFEYLGINKQYVDTYYSEGFKKHSGLRESCEDTVCSECMSYATSGDYNNFKKCKKDCFQEKKTEIEDCCRRMCPNEDAGCLESCDTPLIYGE